MGSFTSEENEDTKGRAKGGFLIGVRKNIAMKKEKIGVKLTEGLVKS